MNAGSARTNPAALLSKFASDDAVLAEKLNLLGAGGNEDRATIALEVIALLMLRSHVYGQRVHTHEDRAS